MFNRNRKNKRKLGLERLMAVAPIHNTIFPQDVDGDLQLSPLDALIVINVLNRSSDRTDTITDSDGESSVYLDVDADGTVSALDALSVINAFNESEETVLDPKPSVSAAPDPLEIAELAEAEAASLQISELEVKNLLERASRATTSNDAIIAIVDRAGQILGVRTEQDVVNTFAGRESDLVFAIDGAVAKARTAAFFSNGEAPITKFTM